VTNNSQEREDDAADADDDDVKKIQKVEGLGYKLELV
jgi:hypothetical protein